MPSNIICNDFCTFCSITVNITDKLFFLYLYFTLCIFFVALRVGRAIMYRHTKFFWNWSYCFLKFLDFSDFLKMAAVRHLGFVWDIFGPAIHEDYFVVSVALQTLVAIDAVVSIIWMFQNLARFFWKSPIHAPQNCFLFDPLNWVQYQRNPQKARKFASFEQLSGMKIRRAVWPLSEFF